MGPKIEGKVLKKGRRGARKPKALKLQAGDEHVTLRGNRRNMGDKARNERGADDMSLISQPMEISVTGVRQLVKIFQNTTVEMRDLLSTECDLVYECKVCRSLYRSVANFLSHKRAYCKEQYSDTRHVFPTSHRVEDQLVIIQPEPVPVMPCSETWKTSDSLLTPYPGVSNDGLVAAEIKLSVPPISSYIRPKRNLSQIVDDLAKKLPHDVKTEPVEPVSAAQFYTNACEKTLAQRDVCKEQTLHLEPVEGTSCAFQTVIPPASSVEDTDLMKTQVAELHGMITANEATLGPLGEIIVINGEGKTVPVDTSITALKKAGKRKSTPFKTKTGIACNICNLDFETRKTFLHHNKRYHAASRVHYPCPCCRDTFANAWNVYRHLYKVHCKSSAQVRRLRSKVLNKVYLAKVAEHESQYTKKKSKTVEPISAAAKVKQEQERMEKENEDWMQDLVDDLGLQMCGGCGRRFERRAALNSHSQTCAKRIEVRKKANRFYPISTVASNSNVQNSNIKLPLFMECAHSSRPEPLVKTEMAITENISSRLTPVSTHSECTMSSGAKSGNSPPLSPVPYESTFSVPMPPVPATMYLRSPNNNGNAEKKIEIQIRRNYFKTEMGSESTSTALGSAGPGPSHSLEEPAYHGTFPIEASTSGKLLEATSSSFQQKISKRSKRGKKSALKKEMVESSMPLKLGNANGYEVEEHLLLPLGLGSNKHSPCVIETSSSEYSKRSLKLNQGKEIKSEPVEDIENEPVENIENEPVEDIKNEPVEDDYEEIASKMRYWRNYPNQNECTVEKFQLQKECIVKDEMQHNEVVSRFSPQIDFVGKVGHNLGKIEAGVGSSKLTVSKTGEQIIRKIKNKKKGRKGKYECYINLMMNGKKRKCAVCPKRYNKVACRRRQVAFKIGYYSYQCMLCDSRYLSRTLCLAHITDEHDMRKTQALLQQKCIKIMLSHSKALRLRSARVQRIGSKNSAIDSDVDLSITVRKAEASDKGLADTEENNSNKLIELSKERYTSKIPTTGDKNGNQNLALFREHRGVRTTRNKEYKELDIEVSKAVSVSLQKKGINRSRMVENTGKSDTDPKEKDSYTLLDSEDRKEHHESEVLVTKPKVKSLMNTNPVKTMENAAAGTSKQKETNIQSTSVVQSVFKVLGGKPLKTETITKDDEDKILCEAASEKPTSDENGNEKRSKLSTAIKLDTEMRTFHPYSNYGDEIIICEETSQHFKQVPCVTKNLSSEHMTFIPLRRSRRLSGQKPVINPDPLVRVTKRTKCKGNRTGQDRSSSLNTVILAKKCTSTHGNLVNVGSTIAYLDDLNDLEDESNSSNIQCCDVNEVMKQKANLNYETDSSRAAVSESCNGSVPNDGNYLLQMNPYYSKQVTADNKHRKLRNTKSKQSSVPIKKHRSTADKKKSFSFKTVSDFESNKVKNLDENGMNREEAGAEEIILQKSNKMPSSRPLRKDKIRLHNPADLPNAESELNRAESVGPEEMEKQPILSEESGMEIPNDLEPSVENSSSGGKVSEAQKKLQKMVMHVIFGTDQDSDTTQQQLSATLNGTQYDLPYASSPSSSSDTSPSSSAGSPAFSVSDMAVSEEAQKTKDEDEITAHKKTVLNSFPEKKQRPVRNRTKLEKEDFIYDLPDRYRDTKRENEDKLSSSSSVTRSRQQTELADSTVASSSTSTAHLKTIPKVVLVRTSTSVQAAKTENDNSSMSAENLVGASEIFGAGSVAYKVSKRKSQIQDAKCKQ